MLKDKWQILVKICFICKKSGCWSTNYLKKKRVKIYEKYKAANSLRYGKKQSNAYLIFLVDFEEEPDDNDIENIKADSNVNSDDS